MRSKPLPVQSLFYFFSSDHIIDFGQQVFVCLGRDFMQLRNTGVYENVVCL